ncbi:hypothetical protein CBS101457_000203 [Exobasidium rhododendri]|nr:hypothetical protein CBS101457_000203 [Exobasidium rhododendri]
MLLFYRCLTLSAANLLVWVHAAPLPMHQSRQGKAVLRREGSYPSLPPDQLLAALNFGELDPHHSSTSHGNQDVHQEASYFHNPAYVNDYKLYGRDQSFLPYNADLFTHPYASSSTSATHAGQFGAVPELDLGWQQQLPDSMYPLTYSHGPPNTPLYEYPLYQHEQEYRSSSMPLPLHQLEGHLHQSVHYDVPLLESLQSPQYQYVQDLQEEQHRVNHPAQQHQHLPPQRLPDTPRPLSRHKNGQLHVGGPKRTHKTDRITNHAYPPAFVAMLYRHKSQRFDMGRSNLLHLKDLKGSDLCYDRLDNYTIRAITEVIQARRPLLHRSIRKYISPLLTLFQAANLLSGDEERIATALSMIYRYTSYESPAWMQLISIEDGAIVVDRVGEVMGMDRLDTRDYLLRNELSKDQAILILQAKGFDEIRDIVKDFYRGKSSKKEP